MRKLQTTQQNGVRMLCPIHKGEILLRMFCHITAYKKPTKQNKRGITGERITTDWWYCEKCKKARQVEFNIK